MHANHTAEIICTLQTRPTEPFVHDCLPSASQGGLQTTSHRQQSYRNRQATRKYD